MALMAFRNAWVDAVKPVKSAIRNLFRDEVAAYLTKAELQAKDTGGTRLVLIAGVPYLYDSTDTTSADNGFNIIVSNDGGRYKIVSGFREKLQANRTYYVRGDGSDSNDGLANTSARAFLTIQKAIDIAANLDCGIYDVSIEAASATYAPFSGKRFIGSGTVTITGSGATIAGATANGAAFIDCGKYAIGGFTFTGCGICIYASGNTSVSISSACSFGSVTTAHLFAEKGGSITANADYAIFGGGVAHAIAIGGMVQTSGRAVTLTGTPAFAAAFAYANGLGTFRADSVTYSGSATGSRYIVEINAVINTGFGGASFLPGNAAGSASTGGQYI